METITIQKDGEKTQVINIPEGARVIIEKGVILVEPEKYILKVGDCVKATNINEEIICVIKEINNDQIITFDYIKSHKVNTRKFFWYSANYYDTVIITPKELQAEFNKLGYEYNFETHEAKKLKWKPKYGEKYYTVLSDCTIDNDSWQNDNIDILRFNIGNCYRTHDEAIPRQQHYLSFKD